MDSFCSSTESSFHQYIDASKNKKNNKKKKNTVKVIHANKIF